MIAHLFLEDEDNFITVQAYECRPNKNEVIEVEGKRYFVSELIHTPSKTIVIISEKKKK